MLDLLADFHFLRPLWLLGIVPVVGLWVALRRAGRLPPSWRRAIAPELLVHLVTNQKHKEGFRPLSMVLPIGLLGCLAMAGPTWELADSPTGPDRSALIVAFELSDSMSGRDVGPTRAARAKFKVKDLLAARGGGQTGLIAYAGTGHVVMPLTDDDRVVLPYLDALSPELMPMPGDAPRRIVPLLERMLASTDAPATVLLVTDGVPPTGASDLVELQRRTGAELVVYGVGTSRGDPSQGAAPIEETGLRQLADATGGTLVKLALGDSDLRRVLRILDRHRRQAAAKDDSTAWEDAGYYLAFPVALLLLVWFRQGWVLRLPAAAALFLSVSGCDGSGFVDLWLTADQQGRALFERGDFAEAGKRFEDPMWKGIALYAAEDWPGAVEALSGVESAEGYFNLGNAYAQGGQWITAIQQYEKALAIRPTFREARANRDLLQSTLDNMKESVDAEDAQKGPPPPSEEDAVKLRKDQEAPKELELADAPVEVEKETELEPLSQETIERWMRRVDTRPADFLRQKFASQAGQEEAP